MPWRTKMSHWARKFQENHHRHDGRSMLNWPATKKWTPVLLPVSLLHVSEKFLPRSLSSLKFPPFFSWPLIRVLSVSTDNSYLQAPRQFRWSSPSCRWDLTSPNSSQHGRSHESRLVREKRKCEIWEFLSPWFDIVVTLCPIYHTVNLPPSLPLMLLNVTYFYFHVMVETRVEIDVLASDDHAVENIRTRN